MDVDWSLEENKEDSLRGGLLRSVVEPLKGEYFSEDDSYEEIRYIFSTRSNEVILSGPLLEERFGEGTELYDLFVQVSSSFPIREDFQVYSYQYLPWDDVWFVKVSREIEEGDDGVVLSAEGFLSYFEEYFYETDVVGSSAGFELEGPDTVDMLYSNAEMVDDLQMEELGVERVRQEMAAEELRPMDYTDTQGLSDGVFDDLKRLVAPPEDIFDGVYDIVECRMDASVDESGACEYTQNFVLFLGDRYEGPLWTSRSKGE
jgi:hypothetical protein